MKFLLLLSVLFSLSAMADTSKSYRACKKTEIKELIEDRSEWLQVFHMLNAKKEIVGAFAYSDSGARAIVCDYVDVEATVASEWFYWDDADSNPATFKKGLEYMISQDEGIARFSVLNTSKSGEVTVRFRLFGWGAEPDYEKEIVFRDEVLTFKLSL